jgi:membrane-bound metal-dependent hydrolase YbcI (DUF457 family)
MDTITHGIAGALLGKGVFSGDDLFAVRPMNRGRVVTWSLMLGAIFPDSDTFRGFFSSNELLILTWHRSITHSLVCLPFFALALAALTRWICRWRKWDAPGLAALTGIYAVGILSHILLDLVTSFGTMIWSPLQWSRPAWDLIFIVDFTFTAILLVPQFLAWVYARPEKLKSRALGSWLIFILGAVAVFFFGRIVNAPFSSGVLLAIIVILTALFLLPALRNFGLRIGRATWNRTGVIAALFYLGCAFFAHRAALARVHNFAAAEHLDVQSIGALPFPPSLWHWDAFVRGPRGDYELPIDLSDPASQTIAPSATSAATFPLEYRFYPDAPTNSYILQARQLPEVQTFFWFARFPVTHFHKESDQSVVDFSDLRFPHIRPDRPASFTYEVRFGPSGNILSQGWLKPR